MVREPKPAIVFLRMSPQLREGLREAADAAGCSLNAFAVQVLATVVGDPSRFRAPVREEPDLRELERDALGFPIEWRANWRHSVARNEFMGVMASQMPMQDWVALVKKYDAEDPAYFVEWQRQRRGAA